MTEMVTQHQTMDDGIVGLAVFQSNIDSALSSRRFAIHRIRLPPHKVQEDFGFGFVFIYIGTVLLVAQHSFPQK
jgi:hypothetical protein